VFELLRLLVDLVPPVAQGLVEEAFEEPVVPQHLQGRSPTRLGEPDTLVLLVGHQLHGTELLEHHRHRGRGDPQPVGQSLGPGQRHRLGEEVDLFQVIFLGFGETFSPI
jgi:hypothetical protein